MTHAENPAVLQPQPFTLEYVQGIPLTDETPALSEQSLQQCLAPFIGGTVVRTATSIQENVTTFAIRIQLAADEMAATVMDTVDTTATQAKQYVKTNAPSLAARVPLVILAFGGSVGLLKEGSRTAYASAKTATYQSVGSWDIHQDSPTISSAVIGTTQDGDQLIISCHKTGDSVVGDAEWDNVTDLRTNVSGYMADKGTNTPVHEGQEAQELTDLGIQVCGATTSGGQENIPQPVNPEYNRTNAVNWALAHAQDPQTNGEECTKFVSEALWAGGLPQTPGKTGWNNDGWYPSGLPFPTFFDGSKTANTAPMLIDYLRKHYSTQWQDLGRLTPDNYDIPLATPGDIIVYSWNGPDSKGRVKYDHMAFVVGHSPDNPQYPLVAEWGQFANYGPADYANNPRSPYVERGWSYSEMKHEWLEQEPGQENMHAYLLHFNGGSLIPNF